MTRAICILAVLVLLALLIPRSVRAACGPYMPWDTVGQATCAPLDVPAVVPPDGRTRTYRSFDSEHGYRWGTVEREATGDWRSWDSINGYRWGRIEVE